MSVSQAASPFPRMRVEPVIQGEFKVSASDQTLLSTVLGSCVSVAMYDPTMRVGGMNHYLLPDQPVGGAADVKYGAMAIELLVNALLKAGAGRKNLRAKLCGGASIVSSLGDIGARNAEFARSYMRREGFSIVAEELGGEHARRFQFHPVTGAARVYAVPRHQERSLAKEEKFVPKTPSVETNVTLF